MQNKSQSCLNKLSEIITNVPTTNYEQWFEMIAKQLFENYAIKTDWNQYRLTEIEFYYHHEEYHPDITAYGYKVKNKKYSDRIIRYKEAQCKTLTWFFHYSGIDIVIGNESTPGGILIRSIENIETGERISGPLVVKLELMNQHISINGTKPLVLELILNENTHPYTLVKKPRIGLGLGGNPDRLYNFSFLSF